MVFGGDGKLLRCTGLQCCELPCDGGAVCVKHTASVTDDGTNGLDPTPDDNNTTDIDDIEAAPDYAVTKVSDNLGNLYPATP